jgi:hypothetical protein
MSKPLRKSAISAESVRLIELLQELNFGRLEKLVIREGEPVLDPPPIVIQKLKMGGDNVPRPEMRYPDFRLKGGVIELLELFSRIQNGDIATIEVRCGLPVSVEVEWRLDTFVERQGS